MKNSRFSTWGENRLAALPHSVRKGCAFPSMLMYLEAMPLCRLLGGAASTYKQLAGKAEPFRTESGKAASALSKRRDPMDDEQAVQSSSFSLRLPNHAT
jgi:hypothetical protein